MFIIIGVVVVILILLSGGFRSRARVMASVVLGVMLLLAIAYSLGVRVGSGRVDVQGFLTVTEVFYV